MEILLTLAIIFIFFGFDIGRKNGLKYWLFDSADGFGASLWMVMGAFMVTGGGWITIMGIVIFVLAAYFLYDITERQVFFKKELWILLLGKISFAIITFGIAMLIAMMYGTKSKK